MKAKQPIRWTSCSSSPFPPGWRVIPVKHQPIKTASPDPPFVVQSLSQISLGAPSFKRTTCSLLDLRFEFPDERLKMKIRAHSRFRNQQDARTKAGPPLETPRSGGVGTFACVMGCWLYASRKLIIPSHGSVLPLPFARVKRSLRYMIHSSGAR